MKIEVKPVITFTNKEYAAVNETCIILDDIVHSDCPHPEILNDSGQIIDLDELFTNLAFFADYVEENQE
jgi:hypothetical protein